MALKDLQSVQVEPGDEDVTTRLWMSFGWELKNKQRVKTQDAQKYTGQSSDHSTSYYETTKGVDFFELTFERDPERKNYSELKSLEGQYYGVKDPDCPIAPVRFGLIWGVLTAVGLFFFPVSIAIIIWRCVRYSKKKKIWDEEYAVYKKELDGANKKRQELLNKAQSLV